MTWLKKFGQVMLKIVAIATGVAPLIQQVIPASAQPTEAKVVSDLTLISNEVMTAEAMFAAISDPKEKMGSDKLKAATPFVSQIIQQWLQSQTAIPKKIQNETLFTQAVTGITSNFADLLNSLGE